jgi:hypothetical protein
VAVEVLELLRLWVEGLDECVGLQHATELFRTPTAPAVQHERAHTALLAHIEALTSQHRALRKQLAVLSRAARLAKHAATP